MNKRICLLIAGVGLLSGCSLAPKYERPATPVAGSFPTTDDAKGKVAAEIEWRQFYQEPRLQALIALALENNRDLRVAALNVDRLRALYRIQRTALIPTINAVGSDYRRRTPGDVNGTGRSVLADTYTAGFEIPSYEVDFFGRVMSLRDQVLQQYLATQEAQTSAQISLISSVARQYFTVLGATEQLALARKSLEAAEANTKLNLQTYEVGLSSEIDLRSAESLRDSYRASVATLEPLLTRAENALVLLVGCPLPNSLPAPSSLEKQALLEDLPAGLPSELLARRPDLRQAERTLQAANANIGVARAAFFPAVKLTATDGSSSSELSGLFTGGQGAWSFTPTITLPIFAAGKNRAQLDAAKIQKNIEVANYEKAIQTAFREVSDALAVRASIGTQIEAQRSRVASAQRRYDLTEQRFRAGIASYMNVLLAQQELFAAQQAYVDARLSRVLNLSSLYAALGGGWQPQPETKR